MERLRGRPLADGSLANPGRVATGAGPGASGLRFWRALPRLAIAAFPFAFFRAHPRAPGFALMIAAAP